MNHILQVSISIEDEKIIKSVEETAHKEIISNLTDKTLDVISEKRWGYGHSRERDFNPLKRMAEKRVVEIIDEHKDFIIEGAIKELANRLIRTKACKEKLNETIEKVL